MEFKVIAPRDRSLKPPTAAETNAPAAVVANVLLEVLNPGTSGDQYVHMTQVPAGHPIAPHSHTQDEVMVVLEGSIRLSDAEHPAGTVVLIPANSHYGFTAGADGLTFLIVRPRKAEFKLA